MSPDLSYALGCPSCRFYVEVSEEDADASLSELLDHVFAKHSNYNRTRAYALLAKAAELTEAEAEAR